MTKRSFIIIFFISLFPFSFINAQNDGAGSTGLSFLKFGVSARAIAMGEAYSSITDDATAMFYNPARLCFGTKVNLSLMHNELVQDVNTDFFAVKFPVSDRVAIGVGLVTTAINNIEIRTIPGAAENTFDARNMATGVSLGYKLNQNLSIGFTGKFLYEKVYVDEASGIGFDLGTNYSKDKYSIAFAISNLGSVNELKYQSSKLPALVRFGASYKTKYNKFDFTLGADGFQILSGGTFHFLTGGEAGYKEFVFLRAGYQTGYDNRGFSTGIGFKYKAVAVDYAFVPYQNDFGNSNTFSLGLNF